MIFRRLPSLRPFSQSLKIPANTLVPPSTDTIQFIHYRLDIGVGGAHDALPKVIKTVACVCRIIWKTQVLSLGLVEAEAKLIYTMKLVENGETRNIGGELGVSNEACASCRNVCSQLRSEIRYVMRIKTIGCVPIREVTYEEIYRPMQCSCGCLEAKKRCHCIWRRDSWTRHELLILDQCQTCEFRIPLKTSRCMLTNAVCWTIL